MRRWSHSSWLAVLASVSLSGTALGGKLVAPSSLSASGISINQISLTWVDPNATETGHHIERSLTSSSGFLQIGSAPQNATSFQDSGLAPGTYFYRVRATGKGNNTSPYSNTASGSTLGATPPPTQTPPAPPPTATHTRTPTSPPSTPTATRTPTAPPLTSTATPVPATPTPTWTPTAPLPTATHTRTPTPPPSTPTATWTPTAPPPTSTATPVPATPTPSGGSGPWTKWYAGGGSFGDSGKSIAVDSTGNVVVAGQYQGVVDLGDGPITSFTNPPSGSTMDAFVAKYSFAGVPVWSRGIGGNASDAATDVSVDSGGNVVVTGYQGSSQVDYGGGPLGTRGSNDIFVAKYDSSTRGDHVWSKTVGGTGPDFGGAVAMDSGGNVFVTGYMSVSSSGVDFGGGTLVSAGLQDAFLVKYSSAGAHVWSKRFGSSGTDLGAGVAVDGSGNVVVVGSFEGTIDLGGGSLTSAGGRDLFVAKFSPAGQHLWSKRFGGTSGEDVRGVAVDGAGDVLLTGQFLGTMNFGGPDMTSAGYEDIFLAKLSATGGHVWSKRLGSMSAPDAGYGVAVDGAGNVAITGFFAGSVNFGGGAFLAQVYDIFVAKYDSAGGYISARRYGDPVGLYDSQYGDAIAMSTSGTVYITGHFVGTLAFGAAGQATSIFAGGSDAYFADVGP